MLDGIWFDIASRAHTSLQKQGGCFNHSVVTMVTDKLERQWL